MGIVQKLLPTVAKWWNKKTSTHTVFVLGCIYALELLQLILIGSPGGGRVQRPTPPPTDETQVMKEQKNFKSEITTNRRIYTTQPCIIGSPGGGGGSNNVQTYPSPNGWDPPLQNFDWQNEIWRRSKQTTGKRFKSRQRNKQNLRNVHQRLSIHQPTYLLLLIAMPILSLSGSPSNTPPLLPPAATPPTNSPPPPCP